MRDELFNDLTDLFKTASSFSVKKNAKFKYLGALAICLMAFSGVFAQSQDLKCPIAAWVNDKDPNGLNVRDKPGTNGKIIGNLKRGNDDDEIMVNIVGYSNGWVKINSATTIEGGEKFNGIGWVSANLVTGSTEQHNGAPTKPLNLYALPKKTSKVVGKIPNETLVKIVGVDCFGLKVSYKGKTGWLSLDDYCGNPVTTCP